MQPAEKMADFVNVYMSISHILVNFQNKKKSWLQNGMSVRQSNRFDLRLNKNEFKVAGVNGLSTSLPEGGSGHKYLATRAGNGSASPIP